MLFRSEAAYTYRATGATAGATVAVAPPEGGFVLLVSGTADVQALMKAQKFPVTAVYWLDVPKQVWKHYIAGAPASVNTLSTLKATDVVVLKR